MRTQDRAWRRFEQDLARYLSNVWGRKVITTRNRLKGAGRQAELGGDFCFEDGSHLPYVIDAKARGSMARSAVRNELAKLHKDAQGRRAVLIWKREHYPLGQCWVIEDGPHGPVWMWLDDWAGKVKERP